MKTKLLSVVLIAASALLAGCGTTVGQGIAAAGIGTGEAIGSYLLKQHVVNGVVDPVYLASYEAEIPHVAGLMQGKVTPADLHNLLANASNVALTSNQTQFVGFLNGVTSEFIQVNGNPLTPDGAQVQAAAQQFAVGLGNAVGLVTGTNYTAPTSMMPYGLNTSMGTVAFRIRD